MGRPGHGLQTALKWLETNKTQFGSAVFSGLMLTAAFPKIGASHLAWVALVPLFFAIRNLSPRECFQVGLAGGLAHFISLLYWLVPTMHVYGYLPIYQCLVVLLAMAAYLSIYMGLLCLAIGGLCDKPQKLLLVPAIWVSLEYLRGILLTGFPWELLGYSQYPFLKIIQIADLFGVYGISFLIVTINVTVMVACLWIWKLDWQANPLRFSFLAVCLLLSLGLAGSSFFYGHRRIQAVDRQIGKAAQAKIAVVQGNIDQSVKWDPAFQVSTIYKYKDLSLSAQQAQPALIVWPETATPFYFTEDTRLSKIVIDGIRSARADFLIGSPSFLKREDGVKYYNSAYLVTANGNIAGKYDKTHLVPFGEYVPLKKWLPFIGKMVAQVGDFAAGSQGNTLKWSGGDLGVQICYEVIFPSLSRAMAINGAQVLVNVTNDAWFGRTSAAYQHFSMAVLRAVENKRALVRSANTGISGFIDPVGRIMGATGLFEEKVLTLSVPMLKEISVYTRYGDFFAVTCLVLVMFWILGSIVRTRSKR
jgi:apolipoprotein N-acyltransferase